ncbi:AP2-binding protein [Pyrus ussuriensis x Pyrus communis]|uniref:AP2-binding protein n=1 Tax=Pyrus ussuriensis x Pyrus communis TaxID=2448454 RepID=A0A5N5FYQ0_9ROSA|nr:AP2-binding protein [Pyrus ussuriensis x Pyrus communis]
MKNHTRLWLRTFDMTEEVALTYDKAAYKLKGDFARLGACTFAITSSSSEAASASTRVMVCLVTEKLREEMGRFGNAIIFCDISDRAREEWSKVGIEGG